MDLSLISFLGIGYIMYNGHSGAVVGGGGAPPGEKFMGDHLKYKKQYHFQCDTTKSLSNSEVIHNNKIINLNSKFYFTHILHSSESLVYNRFYIVYDYNHYNIVYQQYSIYSRTKLSISNFECPNFFTTAVASHYYTYMYALYRALSHSCRSIRLQKKLCTDLYFCNVSWRIIA